jgi:hypothetical protein
MGRQAPDEGSHSGRVLFNFRPKRRASAVCFADKHWVRMQPRHSRYEINHPPSETSNCPEQDCCSSNLFCTLQRRAACSLTVGPESMVPTQQTAACVTWIAIPLGSRSPLRNLDALAASPPQIISRPLASTPMCFLSCPCAARMWPRKFKLTRTIVSAGR